MRYVVAALLAALVVAGAEDPWTKVRALASGTEVKVYKRGVKQPVVAKLDEVRDESIVIATKHEQTAIPKEEIDRIDSRAAQPGGRIKKESKTTTTTDVKGSTPTSPMDSGIPSTSTSSGLSIGSKGDFETVYKRMK